VDADDESEDRGHRHVHWRHLGRFLECEDERWRSCLSTTATRVQAIQIDGRGHEGDLEATENFLRIEDITWQEHFGEILNEMGFMTHPHDACVYIKKVEDSMVMMCCHVDDLLVVGRRCHVIAIFE
jgi:hypothetical protein